VSALDPVTTAVISGALVVGGKWARGQSPNIDNAIGIAGIAIGLAIIDQMNADLASAFAALILVTVAIVHFPAIVKAAGFESKGAK